jgi:hypothetical protein
MSRSDAKAPLMEQNQQQVPPAMEDVLCGVCLDVFTDPKVLACSHIFCSQCLHKACDPLLPHTMRNDSHDVAKAGAPAALTSLASSDPQQLSARRRSTSSTTHENGVLGSSPNLQKVTGFVSCPVCNESTAVTHEGVAGLNAPDDHVITAVDNLRQVLAVASLGKVLVIPAYLFRFCSGRVKQTLDVDKRIDIRI